MSCRSPDLDLSKQQVVTDSVSDVTEGAFITREKGEISRLTTPAALGQHFVWGRQTVRYQAAYTRLVLEGYIKAKLNKGLNLSQIEGKLYKLETTLKNKSATETVRCCGVALSRSRPLADNLLELLTCISILPVCRTCEFALMGFSLRSSCDWLTFNLHSMIGSAGFALITGWRRRSSTSSEPVDG